MIQYQIWMGIGKHGVFRQHEYVIAYQAVACIGCRISGEIIRENKIVQCSGILTIDRFVDALTL